MSLRCIMRSTWIAAAAASLWTSGARAELIVQWDTTGLAGNEATAPATAMATGVTGLDITRSSLLSPSPASNNFGSSGWTNPAQYVQLGFDTTETWNVDTLRLATRSSGTGPGFMNVNVSVDGGAFTTIATITQSGTLYNDQYLPVNEVVHSSLVVQFAPANTTSANGGTIGSSGTWRIGDYYDGQSYFSIAFSGSAVSAVPEPSTLLVGGVSLVFLGVVTRLRRKGAA